MTLPPSQGSQSELPCSPLGYTAWDTLTHQVHGVSGFYGSQVAQGGLVGGY